MSNKYAETDMDIENVEAWAVIIAHVLQRPAKQSGRRFLPSQPQTKPANLPSAKSMAASA